jgi:hypothetical protein
MGVSVPLMARERRGHSLFLLHKETFVGEVVVDGRGQDPLLPIFIKPRLRALIVLEKGDHEHLRRLYQLDEVSPPALLRDHRCTF